MIDKDARNKESDIVVDSVWQLLGSAILVVVSNIDDGWVVKEQPDENGMRRTLSMDIPQFLSFYRLSYTPREREQE